MSDLFNNHPEIDRPEAPSRHAAVKRWVLGLLVFASAAVGFALLLLPAPR